MPAIRMQHPEHGFHHAYDSAEVKRMKEAGWEIEKPAVKVEAKPSDPAPTDAPPAAPKAKPGRKPKA